MSHYFFSHVLVPHSKQFLKVDCPGLTLNAWELTAMTSSSCDEPHLLYRYPEGNCIQRWIYNACLLVQENLSTLKRLLFPNSRCMHVHWGCQKQQNFGKKGMFFNSLNCDVLSAEIKIKYNNITVLEQVYLTAQCINYLVLTCFIGYRYQKQTKILV